jgi:hypothetical protein
MQVPDAFPCELDSECESGICNDGFCIAQPACTLDAACGDLEACRQGRCVPVQCTERNESACGHYRCIANTCTTRCPDNGSCQAGATCEDTHCVPCASGCELRRDGVDCTSSAECRSHVCCQRSNRSACASECPFEATICDEQLGCSAGFCCAQPGGAARLCQSDPCTLGELGDACSTDEYCASHYCVDGRCARRARELGELCESHADCKSGACCATSSTTVKLCRTECLPLTGDFCTSAGGERACSAGYCDTSTNFAPDGYCSNDCDSGCGHNSEGRDNICVLLTPGSVPFAACKPDCDTDEDCKAIHPALSCFSGSSFKACDFDTASWAR